MFAGLVEQQQGTEGHPFDMKLDRSCSCRCFYYERQCRSTERKLDTEQQERERERDREMLAHVSAANGLLSLCMRMCGWAHVYLHHITMGDLVQD